MIRAGLILAFLTLSACGDVPRDQEGTMERIRAMREVRVGVVASSFQAPDGHRLRALIGRSAAAAGGLPTIVEGASEPLLLQLESGALDLVVGEFDRASPWYRRVHLLPPMAARSVGDSRLETTAAARHGENGWILLLEREARALSTRS